MDIGDTHMLAQTLLVLDLVGRLLSISAELHHHNATRRQAKSMFGRVNEYALVLKGTEDHLTDFRQRH